LLLEDHNYMPSYNNQIKDDRYTKFWAELTFYQLSKGRYTEGFNHLLTCLASAHKIKDDSTIIFCVGLYEEYSMQASESVKQNYKNLIKEVYYRYGKKSNVSVNAL